MEKLRRKGFEEAQCLYLCCLETQGKAEPVPTGEGWSNVTARVVGKAVASLERWRASHPWEHPRQRMDGV